MTILNLPAVDTWTVDALSDLPGELRYEIHNGSLLDHVAGPRVARGGRRADPCLPARPSTVRGHQRRCRSSQGRHARA